MAIEGNDWWAIAGAAAGGIVAGVVGAKLVSPKGPFFTGIRRWYEVPSTLDVRQRVMATIWQRGDGYWLKVYPVAMPTGARLKDEVYLLDMIDEGAALEFQEGNFQSMERAMAKADFSMKSMGMDPITEWGYPSEKLKVRG